MKRGKEEDKITGPMFPRLHVNDTDKGGPRAPPRNKMALYEQLSIPSQRFNSNTLPLPLQNARTLAPSASQGNGHGRSVFSPSFVPPSTPAHLAEKVHSRSSDRSNLETTRMEYDNRFTRHVNYKFANAARSVAECSSLRPIDSSSAKNSCRKIADDDDDFRVPTFVISENASSSQKDTTVMETKRPTPSRANSPENGCSAKFNSSVKLPSSYDNPLEPTNTSDMKSGKHERNHSELKLSDTEAMKELSYKSIPHLEAGEKLIEPSKFSKSSSDREHISTINVLEKAHLESSGIHQESCNEPRCLNDIDVQNGNALRVRSESCSKASLGNSHRSLNVADNCNEESDDTASGSPSSRDADRNDEVSETSMVDSISGLDISPDDVVGVIGPKQFWKARRAIVNQQRVFAVQVFELHRLIKVQKLIAASPHLLQENPCITPQKVPTENLPSESNAKFQPQIVKQKDDSQKPNQNTECQTEITGAPSPLHDDGLNKGHGQPHMYMPYSGNLPQVHPTPDNRPSPWCFQPPTNQWLVPVMSPSEGLIYKPYTGPCPPPSGFMAPVYGNYSPMSLPPGYGVPSPHQQQNMGALSGAPAIAPNYFPSPYGLPAVNPIISNSAVEQVSPMTCSRPNGHTEQNSRSSCNMSFPKCDAFTGRPLKFRASKDSELQGSTASSPCERAHGEGRDALPHLPVASAAEGSVRPSESNGKDYQTRVIRVVPHNARSATESAARIFRSIQEERQQFD